MRSTFNEGLPVSTPPGWYNDGSGTQRWWDGNAWGPVANEPPLQPAQPTTGYGPPAGYGQEPGYSQDAGYGHTAGFAQTPPAKKRRTGLIVAIVVGSILLLVAGGVTVGIVAFRNVVNAPKVAITGFNDAWLAGDCDAALEHMEQEIFEAYFVDCATFEATASDENASYTKPPKISFTSVSIVNSNATVETTETFYYDPDEQTFECTYQLDNNGGWIITDMLCN